MMSFRSFPRVIGAVLFIVFSVARGQSVTPPCSSLFGLLPHPTNCSRYLECVWGKPVDRPCAPGTVFSLELQVCVFPWDTKADTCGQAVVNTCVANPSAVFSHPANCHQYYNCSGNSYLVYSPYPRGPDSEAFYRFECPYPQLFNQLTLQCDNFQNVQCGQKFEPINGCDYTRYQCPRAHCRPCWVDFPSCKGLADGQNVYQYREWTPYYVLCENQRLINRSTCPADVSLGIAQFFSPEARKCVSLYEVPAENGGYYLSCTGRPDGLYSDDVTNRPNLYFQCTAQAVTKISLCQAGQRFDASSSSCVS